MQQTTFTIPLTFTKPPLNMNQRLHWAQKAKLTKAIRHEAFVRCRAARIPRAQHITVQLHYQPRDNRRRDSDNLVPTLKALCDGIVDAGVVSDDTPDYMTKIMPTIHPAVKGEPARMWLTVNVA